MPYNTSFSLDKLKEDPSFAQLFAKKAVEVKKNKEDLVSAAKSYDGKYKREIEEGTKKRAVLLEEGRSRGLNEEETFKDSQLFIPTDKTPILNYLYFLMREEKDNEVVLSVLREANDLDKELSVLKEEYDRKYGQEIHNDHKTSDNVPNMLSYLYGNIGDNTMETLKKLKTLAMSDNEKEAFVAFRKGREMAQKYGLDWDKIPYNR
jgi:hypothetical protein